MKSAVQLDTVTFSDTNRQYPRTFHAVNWMHPVDNVGFRYRNGFTHTSPCTHHADCTFYFLPSLWDHCPSFTNKVGAEAQFLVCSVYPRTWSPPVMICKFFRISLFPWGWHCLRWRGWLPLPIIWTAHIPAHFPHYFIWVGCWLPLGQPLCQWGDIKNNNIRLERRERRSCHSFF